MSGLWVGLLLSIGLAWGGPAPSGTQLSWEWTQGTPHAEHGQPTSFVVRCAPARGGALVQHQVVWPQTWIAFKGLVPKADTYTCQVTAWNEQGPGRPSPSITLKCASPSSCREE